MLNVYCLALYASAQIGFSIAQLTVGLSIIVHHLYLDVFIILHLILESRQSPYIYTYRNILFNSYGYHFNVFFLFSLFQKLTRRKEALKTVTWESSHSGQVCRGSDLRLHVRRGHRSNTPQRQRTVIPFAWESAELRLLKVQLDNHETALSIAKGKGVRQPVARDQHDRLSDLPRPANAPAWAYS